MKNTAEHLLHQIADSKDWDESVKVIEESFKDFGVFINAKYANAMSGGIGAIKALPESIDEWYDKFTDQ